MKKLMLLAIGLAFSTIAKSQDSESNWTNAADPTQLYTNINLDAGINFSSGSGIFGPEYWIMNIGSDIAINKFNFGFNLPLTNVGNEYSFLGDIDLHVGYQLYSTDKFFKSSLVTVGFIAPSSFNGDGFWGGYSEFYSFNTFYLNYVMSLKLSDKFSAYPKIGGYMGNYADQDWADIIMKAFEVGTGLNYQFNKKNFLQLNLDWINKTVDHKDETNNDTYTMNRFVASLKYQYAIGEHAQLYVKLQNDFGENVTTVSYDFLDSSLQGAFVGLQYYLK